MKKTPKQDLQVTIEFEKNIIKFSTFDEAKQKAEQGDREAQFALYIIYLNGWQSIKANPTLAREWCLYSALQGYAPAQYSYGPILRNEQSPEQYSISSEFVSWFQAAADQDCLSASEQLGDFYLEQGNQELAQFYLEKAVFSGSINASYKLGLIYRNSPDKYYPVAAMALFKTAQLSNNVIIQEGASKILESLPQEEQGIPKDILLKMCEPVLTKIKEEWTQKKHIKIDNDINKIIKDFTDVVNCLDSFLNDSKDKRFTEIRRRDNGIYVAQMTRGLPTIKEAKDYQGKLLRAGISCHIAQTGLIGVKEYVLVVTDLERIQKKLSADRQKPGTHVERPTHSPQRHLNNTVFQIKDENGKQIEPKPQGTAAERYAFCVTCVFAYLEKNSGNYQEALNIFKRFMKGYKLPIKKFDSDILNPVPFNRQLIEYMVNCKPEGVTCEPIDRTKLDSEPQEVDNSVTPQLSKVQLQC